MKKNYCFLTFMLLVTTTNAAPLSTFLQNFALDKNTSHSANDWNDVRIKQYKWKGDTLSGYSAIVKIDNVSSGAFGNNKVNNNRIVIFKGTRTMVFTMNVEQQTSLYEELNSLDEIKDKGMKVRKIGSKCNENYGVGNYVQLYEVKLPNKKPLYSLETASSGSAGNTIEWIFSIDKIEECF